MHIFLVVLKICTKMGIRQSQSTSFCVGERFQQKSLRGRAKRSNINNRGREERRGGEEDREEEKHAREGSGGRKLQEVLGQQEEAAPGRPTDPAR